MNKGSLNILYTALALTAFWVISALYNPALSENRISANKQEQTIKQQPNTPDHYVTFRVLAEKTSVKPGEEILVGVEQSIYPGWHTYWKNPGDSGSASRHDWTLPTGFTIKNIQWPAPHKIPYPPLLNYGYTDKVLLLQKLHIPETLPNGPITLTVDVETLVCKDICIPEYGSFDLTLNDPASLNEDNRAYFDQTLAKIPQDQDWQATFTQEQSNFVLKVNVPDDFLANIDQKTLQFIPVDWGIIENAAPVDLQIQGNELNLTQRIGERPLKDISGMQALLTYDNNQGQYKAARITAKNANALITQAKFQNPAEPNGAISNSAKTRVTSTGLIKAFALALLGGLVLNLMPCVFPVLSLKALSLVKFAEKGPALARWHGIAYTAGIVLSFLLIAAILISLQAGGQQIGWGFQLQSPVVVALLAYLLFVIGLNLAGYFDITASYSNFGQKLTQGNDLTSSFFTGVLATIVATPCTAPFMGVAIGYALLQSPPVALTIFAALGLGLALPYLALAFIPSLQKLLPRPGAWMDVFKQLLSFPMFGFSAWLVWVLAQLTGPFNVFGILLGMLCIVFGIWLLKHSPSHAIGRTLIKILAAFALLCAFAFIPSWDKTAGINQNGPGDPTTNQYEFGQKFSPEDLSTALSGSAPVFVEMTAAWCITCKVNHATSINIDKTKTIFAENNVQYFIGDWTNEDPVITEYLNDFGRNGVPIYVFYGARNNETGQRPDAVLLPQILTPRIIEKAITGT